MKKEYTPPVAEIIALDGCDIITSSPGAETPWGDMGFGDW